MYMLKLKCNTNKLNIWIMRDLNGTYIIFSIFEVEH